MNSIKHHNLTITSCHILTHAVYIFRGFGDAADGTNTRSKVLDKHLVESSVPLCDWPYSVDFTQFVSKILWPNVDDCEHQGSLIVPQFYGDLLKKVVNDSRGQR